MEGNPVKQKILIYDDEEKQTERFASKLKQALEKVKQDQDFDIETLCEDTFQDSMEVLQEKQRKFRNNEPCPDPTLEFDDTSIFIIDYDLLKSQETKFLTGEIIAYVARAFSECKLIVGLNQYGHNPFDLTLRGHPESFADLNLGEDQLSNPDLWRGDWGELRRGYRPWYWPNLSDVLRDFDKRVKEVRENLDKPICEVLGFDPKLFRLLPRGIVQFIGKSEGKESADTTFREFVLQSGNGLRSKDVDSSDDVFASLDDDIFARVGAARISKWLERLVLPEQDILVDAPHLVSRYPSLIAGDGKEIQAWNRTAQLVDYRELGLNTDLIEPYRFKKDYWVSRPVWFWDKLRECERIQEVTESWKPARRNWVFCEDASRFYNRKDCKEFLADIDSPFTRRFVKDFKGVNYRPRVRFSL
jgi:hypothetical protein